MREKVRAFMEQYHMVTAGERVLLGLSGGADSVCLFHLQSGYHCVTNGS